MIVGTAGHIDHGKTTLVRALTGIDADRLPEEKKRGISIELGYAFLEVPGVDEPLGFIDVPGHERLVHTMLAGATGIDLALLLVAADDGPMPQTREHLAVLSLLGLDRGAVVVTKVDRVDAARRAAVRQEVAELVRGSVLARAPCFEVAATTGEGLPALRDWLGGEARRGRPATDPGAAFRLAIDRAFTLAGVGTVVTGTVHAGRVRVGDLLQRLPGSGGQARAGEVRVRSVRAQNREVDVAQAGQRCALGLVGVAKDEIHRGQWLVGDDAVSVGERLDVSLRVAPGEARALRSGTPVQVHLGAAQVEARVAVLGPPGVDAIAPGAEGWAQLVLRAPLGAWRGDRVVLRDASATRAVAGGRVLDPQAPARWRRTPQRLAALAAWTQALAPPDEAAPPGAPATALAVALQASPLGLDLEAWRCVEGRRARPDDDPAQLVALASADGRWWLAHAEAQAVAAAALQALDDEHARAPDRLGPDTARLRRRVAPRLPEPLWLAVLAALVRDGAVALRGGVVHRPAHAAHLSAVELRLAQKLAPALEAAGAEGAWVRDLARDAGEAESLVRQALARLAQRGEMHQVVKDLYLAPQTVATLARLVRALQAREGEVRAAGFRDATGLGRKRAIQILEYFDHIGLLRRVGDTHRLRADTHLFLDEAAASGPEHGLSGRATIPVDRPGFKPGG